MNMTSKERAYIAQAQWPLRRLVPCPLHAHLLFVAPPTLPEWPSAKVHRPGQRWPALASGRSAGHRAIADTGKFLARFGVLARCVELARHGQSISPGHRAFLSPVIHLLASNPVSP
jgi:hypothetical protein